MRLSNFKTYRVVTGYGIVLPVVGVITAVGCVAGALSSAWHTWLWEMRFEIKVIRSAVRAPSPETGEKV